MARGTLWSAMERDRRRWIRAGAIVLMLVVLLVLACWFVVVVRSPRALEVVFRVVVPLVAILAFPLIKAARELRVSQSIGAVPVATGMLPDTKSALYDVSLASGLGKPPALLMYYCDAVNAFAMDTRKGFNIAVSSSFAELPKAQQRAGFAMLVGRSRVDTTSFAAEHQLAESTREDPLPPDRDPVLFSAWLDTAVAGDREGLRILGEPIPMIELLERLSITPTDVPGFAYSGGHDAVFGFLAWPYVDTGKVLSEEVTAQGEGLPPRAAAAVAALIAEERTMNGMVRSRGSGAALSGAEAIRALRLREVAGAEGAIAGSTSAAAKRADAGRSQATSPDPTQRPGVTSAGAATIAGAAAAGVLAASYGTPPRTVRAPGGADVTYSTTVSVTRIPASPPAVSGASGDAAQTAGTAADPPAADLPAADSPAAARPTADSPAAARPAERIVVRCPVCRADNAPGNRTCVACGKPMPRQD